jgi:hypothetical protein
MIAIWSMIIYYDCEVLKFPASLMLQHQGCVSFLAGDETGTKYT